MLDGREEFQEVEPPEGQSPTDVAVAVAGGDFPTLSVSAARLTSQVCGSETERFTTQSKSFLNPYLNTFDVGFHHHFIKHTWPGSAFSRAPVGGQRALLELAEGNRNL